ncbi:MAG: DJ-1/PfpI family protein [Treponema sp.]|jgi:4-methyl-5(b-hydroxyethyl)-thiazole monophosphate biosynthesis|nr:DJ-1/PfpI family protein [Treponema sp.]
MSKKVIVLLADGFEEVEAVTPVDYLRRAGIEVTTAAVGGTVTVKGARGIPLNADTTLKDLIKRRKQAAFWDAAVIPGGMPGAANIAASKDAADLLMEMNASGKWVCAICASPAVVLAPLGIVSGRKFTCFPSMEENVTDGKWSIDPVVIDENPAGGGVITSRAAGTAGAFALAIIGKLLSEADVQKVAQAVLL